MGLFQQSDGAFRMLFRLRHSDTDLDTGLRHSDTDLDTGLRHSDTDLDTGLRHLDTDSDTFIEDHDTKRVPLTKNTEGYCKLPFRKVASSGP